MRRMLLVLSVAAVLAVMLVVSATPGFAHAQRCGKGGQLSANPAFLFADKNGNGQVCEYDGATRIRDDHVHRS